MHKVSKACLNELKNSKDMFSHPGSSADKLTSVIRKRFFVRSYTDYMTHDADAMQSDKEVRRYARAFQFADSDSFGLSAFSKSIFTIG